MTSLKAELHDIEAMVLARKIEAAQGAIARYLRATKREPLKSQAIFQACDWFRRLGLFTQGLALVEPERSLNRSLSSRSTEGKRLVWFARFLNSLGASEYAAQILKQLRLVTCEEFRLAGEVSLTNFDYANALTFFRKMELCDENLESYSSRIASLYVCDALAGLGEFDEAMKVLSEISVRARQGGASESYLQGICLQMEGEFLARKGNWTKSLQALEKALPYFPNKDTTADKAILMKWLGSAYAKAEKVRESRTAFAQSLQCLKKPEIRAEAWLSVYRCIALAGQLKQDELHELRCYPGGSREFKKFMEIPGKITCGDENSKFLISLKSDEYRLRDQWHLNVPLELKLLAYVRLSGEFGIGSVRLKSLIWPDEAFSFLKLEDRLRKLVKRLEQEYSIRVVKKDGWYRVNAKQAHGVCVLSGEESMPAFLLQGKEFTSQNLDRWYSLSRTQRIRVLQDWTSKCWIERRGKPPKTTYFPNFSAYCKKSTFS